MDTKTLVDAIATILADRTDWAWQPEGPAYTAQQTGIFYGAISDSPDQAIGITVYASLDDHVTTLTIRRAQLRFRGAQHDPAGADDLADTAFTILQGLARVAGISLITRESSAPLGADENDRQVRTDNYQIIIDNQEV